MVISKLISNEPKNKMIFIDGHPLPIALGHICKCEYLSRFSIFHNKYGNVFADLNSCIGITKDYNGYRQRFLRVEDIGIIKSYGTKPQVIIQFIEWMRKKGFSVSYKWTRC